MRFSQILCELRKQYGLSQQGLGEKVGFADSQIGRCERGEARPSVQMIHALSWFFDVTPEQMVGTDASLLIDLTKQIGRRLKYERLTRGLTQSQLGCMAGGMTKYAIYHYERDNRIPREETLRRLARALDMEPAELQQPPTVSLPEEGGILIGERLKYERKRRGMSQRELAEITQGIHKKTISRYEVDNLAPGELNLIKLAKALNMTVKELTKPVTGSLPAISKHIGERLKYERRKKGLYQHELGEKAGGLPRVWINEYENNKRAPNPRTLRRLAQALEIPVEVLLKPIDKSCQPTGERLRYQRYQSGLSQVELAEKAGGLKGDWISEYELGKVTPGIKSLIRLANALEVSTTDMLRPLHIDLPLEGKYISKRLREERLKKELTQRELEERAGIGEGVVYVYEKGLSAPRQKNLGRLAKVLNIPVEALLDPDNERSTKEMIIGIRINKERNKQGLSLKTLGEKSGVGKGVISQYERGRRLPTQRNLMRLARALGVSEDDLWSFHPGQSEGA